MDHLPKKQTKKSAKSNSKSTKKKATNKQSTKGKTTQKKQKGFNFIHANVNYLEITVDGVPVPHRPFKPNFSANDYIPSYLSLMDSDCSIHKGVSITYSDYPSGYTIFIFDIQSFIDSNVMTKPKKGHVSLNLGFSEAIDKTINVIVYAKFPDVVQIDQSRKVRLSSFASKSK